MTTHNPVLTPQQYRLIHLIAGGAKLAEAASLAGVHRNTIRNWQRANPVFAAEFHLATSEQDPRWYDLPCFSHAL